jgi:hypothetical protein
MKYESEKNSIFPLVFEDSKNCTNDQKLDVSFCVDTFSYNKLFHPTSYAKVMAVLLGHNFL